MQGSSGNSPSVSHIARNIARQNKHIARNIANNIARQNKNIARQNKNNLEKQKNYLKIKLKQKTFKSRNKIDPYIPGSNCGNMKLKVLLSPIFEKNGKSNVAPAQNVLLGLALVIQPQLQQSNTKKRKSIHNIILARMGFCSWKIC